MSYSLEVVIPIIMLVTAIFSAYSAYQANKISSSVRKFQEKLFLNQDEIKISQEILDKLTFYNVWCNDESKIGSLGINYNNTDAKNYYYSRDVAFSAIPNEIKVLCVKLQTRSEDWKSEVQTWENGLLYKSENNYCFDRNNLEEKILCFKKLRAELLQV